MSYHVDRASRPKTILPSLSINDSLCIGLLLQAKKLLK